MSEPARETAESYDRIVDSYEAHSAEPPPERTAFLDRFIERVHGHGLVLDAGCGPGHDLDAMAARGLTARGLDASMGMARRAHSRGHAVLAADLRRPPVQPGCLDGLWSSASLLHVPRADVPPTFAAWRRLLRPGGVLGLITSVGDDEGWEAVPYAPAAQHAGIPLRRWFVHHRRESLTQLLIESGFTVEYCGEREGRRRWLQILAAT
jgi:SAM-dependent methyltransferase